MFAGKLRSPDPRLAGLLCFWGPSLRQRPHQQKSSSVWRGSGLALFIYVYTPIHTHACVHTYMLLRVESTARRHNFATPSRHAFAQAFVWGLDYEPAYLACTLLPFRSRAKRGPRSLAHPYPICLRCEAARHLLCDLSGVCRA